MNRYDKNDKISYCLGMSLTVEALKHRSGFVKEVILSSKATKNRQFDHLMELCRMSDVPFRYGDRDIEKLSLKENCYCIGVFEKYETGLSDGGHVVLCGFDDLTDLGTLIRSAVSFDQRNIVLIGSDIDHFDPRCVRSSMGSIFLCDIASFDSIDSYLERFPDHHVYPFTSKGKHELSRVSFEEPYSLIIPSGYRQLDELFEDGIVIDHHSPDEISLSIRSSIIFSHVYHLKRRR